VNFAIVAAIFLLFLLLDRKFPGLVAGGGDSGTHSSGCFTMGLGIFLATVNVFYRDINQSIGVLLQFWFWFTPSSTRRAPCRHREIDSRMESDVVACPRLPTNFLDQAMPDWASLVYPFALTLFSSGSACSLFTGCKAKLWMSCNGASQRKKCWQSL